MVAGHALPAVPAAWTEIGIMIFMAGEKGVVLDADLGENTIETANTIESFYPGGEWRPASGDVETVER